jgi:hypothetical protein
VGQVKDRAPNESMKLAVTFDARILSAGVDVTSVVKFEGLGGGTWSSSVREAGARQRRGQ